MRSRRIEGRAGKALATLLVLLLVLGVTAMPAGAVKPEPFATVATTGGTGCVYTVGYTWKNFRGKGLTAVVELHGYANGADTGVIGTARFEGLSGKRGSVEQTFTLQLHPGETHMLFSKGALYDGGTPVAGSAVEEAPMYSSCF